MLADICIAFPLLCVVTVSLFHAQCCTLCMCVGQHKIVQIPFEINRWFADIAAMYVQSTRSCAPRMRWRIPDTIIKKCNRCRCHIGVILFVLHFFFARANVSTNQLWVDWSFRKWIWSICNLMPCKLIQFQNGILFRMKFITGTNNEIEFIRKMRMR